MDLEQFDEGLDTEFGEGDDATGGHSTSTSNNTVGRNLSRPSMLLPCAMRLYPSKVVWPKSKNLVDDS
jgi:hypothetical protein